MGVKSANHASRIIFLQKFTEEIIKNLIAEYVIEHNIKIEKLKQKIVEPQPPTGEVFRKVPLGPEFIPSIAARKMPPLTPQRRPTLHRAGIPMQRSIQSVEKRPMRLKRSIQQPRALPPPSAELRRILDVRPEAAPTPKGFALGKIEPFLRDPSVQLIECSGPGKNVLVKKFNKMNITKISLNKEEITNIINKFSEEARIPIIGGILKAAVGDLIISAVVSEFVGSRFIINKITPFNLIDTSKIPKI